MKVHEVIISLASNENQEANLAKAREQLTQLMVEVHFTSAIWTEPVATSRKEPYLNQLCRQRQPLARVAVRGAEGNREAHRAH